MSAATPVAVAVPGLLTTKTSLFITETAQPVPSPLYIFSPSLTELPSPVIRMLPFP